MIFKDDYTRHPWMYCLPQKCDAVAAFRRFLGVACGHGTLSIVEFVRSDKGGRFVWKAFRGLCDEHGIRQESTTTGRPKCNDVAERALGLNQDAAAATVFEARRLFPTDYRYF